MKVCYRCGKEQTGQDRVSIWDVCASCNAYLHCCKNCRLFSPLGAQGCKSRTVEFVSDKGKANYCDEFVFKESIEESRKEKSNTKDAWNKLFQK